jgi:hypothetical protein
VSETGLAVVECRWWEHGNDSVRPLFETLSGLVEGNPHSVRYDMFAEERSLRAIVDEVASCGKFHSIYLASHGDNGSISGIGGAAISRTVLRNMLDSSNKKRSANRVKGLYFGSCLVGNFPNAQFWLDGTPTTGLEWVAGYQKSVDWVDSSAVDMIFWSKYLKERKQNRSRRSKFSEIEMVKKATREMKDLMPNVFGTMGFNVYHKDSGGVVVSVW